MEENKVILTLTDYLKMYDNQKENDKEKEILLELVFNDTELTNNNQDLKFDYYNSKLMKFLKEKYPERYKEQVEFLKNEN